MILLIQLYKQNRVKSTDRTEAFPAALSIQDLRSNKFHSDDVFRMVHVASLIDCYFRAKIQNLPVATANQKPLHRLLLSFVISMKVSRSISRDVTERGTFV